MAADLKQCRVHQANLGYFSAHSVDFDAVAHAHSILAHQHEPSEEGEDEILQDDGDACGDKAEDGGHLLRHPKMTSRISNAPNTWMPKFQHLRNVRICLCRAAAAVIKRCTTRVPRIMQMRMKRITAND